MSTIILTKLILDRYFSNKRNSKICFINLSSISGEIPDPCNSIYSATKRFIDVFSKGIQDELLRDNIRNIKVFSVKPSYVSTCMVPISPTGFRVISTKKHCIYTFGKNTNINI